MTIFWFLSPVVKKAVPFDSFSQLLQVEHCFVDICWVTDTKGPYLRGEGNIQKSVTRSGPHWRYLVLESSFQIGCTLWQFFTIVVCRTLLCGYLLGHRHLGTIFMWGGERNLGEHEVIFLESIFVYYYMTFISENLTGMQNVCLIWYAGESESFKLDNLEWKNLKFLWKSVWRLKFPFLKYWSIP